MQCIKLDPEYASAHYSLALLLDRHYEDEREKSEEHFKRALYLKPQDESYWRSAKKIFNKETIDLVENFLGNFPICRRTIWMNIVDNGLN
eukprot:UN34451